MTYGNYSMAHEDYRYRYQLRYGQAPVARANNTQVAQNGTYASGISDAGFSANTCTDGKDDGKIGFFSAIGNALEGVVKGAVNGIKGMFTDSEGNFSLGKTLLSIGMAAVCIAFPAVGVAACAVGAVAGGVQVVKGAVAASNAKTDAEAKAAWENMGEGGATVVGCALGAKASLGAMKSTASLSAIDDVAKAAGKSTDDILGSVDDLAKVMDSADDSAKAASKFLKSKGITNADDVLSSVDDVTDATKIMDAAKTQGKSSSLDALKAKDLQGAKKFTETAKAFGKDALSSTKNNGKALWKKASDTLSAIDDYKTKKTDLDEAKKAVDNARKDMDAAGEDYIKSQENIDMDATEKAGKRLSDAAEKYDEVFAKQKEAQKALDGTKIQQLKQSGIDTVESYRTANGEYKAAKKALRTATREGRKQGLKGDDLTSFTSAQQQAVNAAKAKTPFGQLTTRVGNTNFGRAMSELKTSKNPIKTITSNMNKQTITKITNALGDDLRPVWQFMQTDKGTYAKAVQEFGYSNVAQVLQVLYAYGQTEQMV